MADEVVQHYIYNMSGYQWPDKFSEIKDGYTTNPIKYTAHPETDPGEDVAVTAGDYILDGEYQFKLSADKDPIVPSYVNEPLYVYTLNGDWKYVGGAVVYDEYLGCSIFDGSGTDIKLDEGDGHFYEGSTCDKIVVSPYNKEGITSYYVENYDGTGGYKYYGIYPDDWNIESPTLIEHTETQTVTVNYGDRIVRGLNSDDEYTFQYPGIWVVSSDYPKLDIPIPEPKYKGHVQLKWTDPPDITDWKPTPATWEGTVIVRKENSAPLHRWDGDKVIRTTTRDKYKSKPYKDEDIETNKVYYYAFMPYYTKIDDPQHPIRYYTFTKCIRVETGTISYIPEIIKIDMDEDVATITYSIVLPATGPYDTAKLYGKKDDNPSCDNTDDIVLDISQVDDQVVVSDIDGDYFFCIQVTNGTDTFTSDVVSCYGENPGPQPDPQYVEYIDLINGNNNLYKYYMTDNWMQLYDGTTRGFYYFNDKGKKYTYVISNGRRRSIRHWNNSTYSSSYITYHSGNYYSTYNCYALDIIDININGNNDSYTITTSLLNANPNFINNRFGENIPCYAGTMQFYYDNNTWNFGVSTDTTSKPTVEDITYTGTLEDCFKYLAMNVRNANIYVNGTLWALSANND